MTMPPLLWAAPEFDEEECRDQAEFPEEKEVKEILRSEGAEEAGLKEQEKRVVERHTLLNLRGGGHANGNDDGAEEQHEEAKAVDADVIVDRERRDPGVGFLELECA